jgi:hypothetical protein
MALIYSITKWTKECSWTDAKLTFNVNFNVLNRAGDVRDGEVGRFTDSSGRQTLPTDEQAIRVRRNMRDKRRACFFGKSNEKGLILWWHFLSINSNVCFRARARKCELNKVLWKSFQRKKGIDYRSNMWMYHRKVDGSYQSSKIEAGRKNRNYLFQPWPSLSCFGSEIPSKFGLFNGTPTLCFVQWLQATTNHFKYSHEGSRLLPKQVH